MMMKTFTPIHPNSRGARHHHRSFSAMYLFIFLLSFLTLLTGSARAEGEDTGTGSGIEETSSTIFQYTEVEGGISISGFKDGCSAEALVIPSEIDGKPVVAIGKEAFESADLTSIEIPSSLTTIGDYAFWECKSLTSVTFADNSQLTSIGLMAFYCTGITSVKIPSSVTTIAKGAFWECKSLTSVTFADNSQLTSIGGSAFVRTAITSIEFPSSLTTIGEYTFDSCESLTSVTFRRIPVGENTIGGYANGLFVNDINLNTISVPKGTEETYKAQLADYADLIQGVDIVFGGLKYAVNDAMDGLVCEGFSGDAVAEVTIPAKVQGVSVTAIGKQAFRSKTSITSVSIPSTVKEISMEAFYNCKKLVNVSIADDSQLTTIGQGAFCQCIVLEDVAIPSSVETIGEDAFSDCFKLSSVTFQRIPTEENSISGYSADMFLPSSSDRKIGYVNNLFVPRGTVAAYAAQLPIYSDIIMVDGGKVTLTDETGFACEDKTLYRASDLRYERSLKTEGEEPGDDTPGESAQAQYATVCLPFALDLGKTDGIFDKVYAPMNTLIHHTKKSTPELEHFILMLQEQEPDAIIPAGQPVLVKLSDGTDHIALSNQADVLLTAALQPKTEAMTVVDWDGTSGLMAQNKQFSISYKGTFLPQEAKEADHLWTFNPDGTFGKQTEGTVHPFRLVLNVEKENEADNSGSEDSEGSEGSGSEAESPASQAKQYVFSIGVTDGTTTGIREILTSEAIHGATQPNGSSSANAAGIIYDLSGRKVATAATGSQDVKHLRKGIYVVNGKKMVVK